MRRSSDRLGPARVLILALGVWFVPLGRSAVLPPVVARINGTEITAGALERRMRQSRSMDPKRADSMNADQEKAAMVRVLRSMIIEEIEYREAVIQRIAVTDQEVEADYVHTKEGFPGFERSLAMAGSSPEEWKDQYKRSLMISRLEKKVLGEGKDLARSDRRREWLKDLVTRGQIWMWNP